jgi:hypothetical protein
LLKFSTGLQEGEGKDSTVCPEYTVNFICIPVYVSQPHWKIIDYFCISLFDALCIPIYISQHHWKTTDGLCVSLFDSLGILIHARQHYCQIKDDFQFLSSVFFDGHENALQILCESRSGETNVYCVS